MTSRANKKRKHRERVFIQNLLSNTMAATPTTATTITEYAHKKQQEDFSKFIEEYIADREKPILVMKGGEVDFVTSLVANTADWGTGPLDLANMIDEFNKMYEKK